MPAGRANPHAWITHRKFTIRADRHRSNDLPVSHVMVEAPQRRLLTGLQKQTRYWIWQVWELNRRRPIKIFRTIRLHSDDEGEIQPLW
jgi:hypothetical protein